MNRRLAIGTPLAIEWEEASGLVYIRENFEFFTIDGQQYCTYDETHYPVQEFLNTRFQQIRADIDYISMMAEVDL